MANSDVRKTAADARRVAGDKADKETVKKFREALKDNYDRGYETGRAEAMAELKGLDLRTGLLDFCSEILEAAGALTSKLPKSAKQTAAYREASAILRDAKGK